MSPAQRDAAAQRLLGYVPASPDGSEPVFDERTGEVRNARHGSFRQPVYHDRLSQGSGLARLVGSLHQMKASLRFREDGVHTLLTITRRAPGK
jgi:hypothetical protein